MLGVYVGVLCVDLGMVCVPVCQCVNVCLFCICMLVCLHAMFVHLLSAVCVVCL